MVSEKDVLFAMSKNRDENNIVDRIAIEKKLKLDDMSLIPFLKELNKKGYITQTLENIEITELGLSACKKPSLFHRLFNNFSKFMLNIIVDIVVALIIAFLIYHFGWQ
jgi:Mn-dependent DtxR family transcriptional regulator